MVLSEATAPGPPSPFFELLRGAVAGGVSTPVAPSRQDGEEQPRQQEPEQQDDEEQQQQQQTEEEEEEEEVDLSRAGVLLGRIDTPALACYTEHGAVPYLTRDLLLEVQARHPRSFGLLYVDMRSSLPVKEGALDPGALEAQACNPPGRFITCLGARDPLGGVAANCTPAQVSVETLYGRRSLTPAAHAALVSRLRPALATAVMDEAPASASRTRQQKAVERSQAWLDHLLKATAPEGGEREGEGKEVAPWVLAGIVGGTDLTLRKQSAKAAVSRPVSGVSVGGLGMGESPRERRAVLRTVAGQLPPSLLRACVGLSTPLELLDAMLAGGVDVLNTAYPIQLTLLGHALVFPLEMDGDVDRDENEGSGGLVEGEKQKGPERKKRRLERGTAAEESEVAEEAGEAGEADGPVLNLWDRRWRRDARPLAPGCPCLACRRHSRAYLHHLLQAHEMAAEVLLHAHNLEHCLAFFEAARRHVLRGKGSLRRYRQHVQRAWASWDAGDAPLGVVQHQHQQQQQQQQDQQMQQQMGN